MTQRNYPFNDYPYCSYPYFDRSGYPYGDSLEQNGRVASQKKVGAHSPGSVAWSLLVLIGLAFWLTFRICRIIVKLIRAVFRLLTKLI